MSSFRIPLVWQMYGHMDVEAKSLHEYVDDSIQVDDLLLNQEATHESHQ